MLPRATIVTADKHTNHDIAPGYSPGSAGQTLLLRCQNDCKTSAILRFFLSSYPFRQ
jgi:hypothetical protein